MKKAKPPKINYMLIEAYFNISYKRYWHPAWLQHCNPEKQILQAIF